jgi:BirA family biotin operon repressor/biotin-[acetyl-CoA-carboxylase] ligase
MTARFEAAHFSTLVRARGLTLGEPLAFREVTGSTNDDALAAASAGAPSGAVFVADAQRSGRGRRGSTWYSEPDASLSFSVLLRPDLTPERASGLSLVAGLAVRQAVDHLLERRSEQRARVSVKWPNDVWLGGRKLAGVLSESKVHGGKLVAAVVGIGLNLGRVALPDSVQFSSTSLAEAGVTNAGREELLADILAELANRLESFAANRGEMLPKTLLEEFHRHDALRGLRISVEGATGRGAGIDGAGNLLVESEDGTLCRVAAGHVEILGFHSAGVRS